MAESLASNQESSFKPGKPASTMQKKVEVTAKCLKPGIKAITLSVPPHWRFGQLLYVVRNHHPQLPDIKQSNVSLVVAGGNRIDSEAKVSEFARNNKLIVYIKIESQAAPAAAAATATTGSVSGSTPATNSTAEADQARLTHNKEHVSKELYQDYIERIMPFALRDTPRMNPQIQKDILLKSLPLMHTSFAGAIKSSLTKNSPDSQAQQQQQNGENNNNNQNGNIEGAVEGNVIMRFVIEAIVIYGVFIQSFKGTMFYTLIAVLMLFYFVRFQVIQNQRKQRNNNNTNTTNQNANQQNNNNNNQNNDPLQNNEQQQNNNSNESNQNDQSNRGEGLSDSNSLSNQSENTNNNNNSNTGLQKRENETENGQNSRKQQQQQSTIFNDLKNSFYKIEEENIDVDAVSFEMINPQERFGAGNLSAAQENGSKGVVEEKKAAGEAQNGAQIPLVVESDPASYERNGVNLFLIKVQEFIWCFVMSLFPPWNVQLYKSLNPDLEKIREREIKKDSGPEESVAQEGVAQEQVGSLDQPENQQPGQQQQLQQITATLGVLNNYFENKLNDYENEKQDIDSLISELRESIDNLQNEGDEIISDKKND